MKEISQMTEDEVATAFCVIMDSAEQDRLMNNPEDPDSWMLDFVYDSELRNKLEEYSLKLTQAKELDSMLSVKKGKESKSKV